MPNHPHAATRFIEHLVSLLATAERSRDPLRVSLTGYWFSNSGQAPDIRIYRLNAGAIAFLEHALHHADGSLVSAWHRAIDAHWRQQRDTQDTGLRANALYEAVLALPDQAVGFARRFLIPAHHWGLVALFLQRMDVMQPERIALLRQIGQRCADYARQRRSFFYQFSRTDDYSPWRRYLLRAADDCMRRSGEPLVTFDEFVQAFTAPPGEVNDWRLARDLVTLVMIEQRAGGDGDESDYPTDTIDPDEEE